MSNFNQVVELIKEKFDNNLEKIWHNENVPEEAGFYKNENCIMRFTEGYSRKPFFYVCFYSLIEDVDIYLNKMLKMNFFRDVKRINGIPHYNLFITEQGLPSLFPQQNDVKFRYNLLNTEKNSLNICNKIYTQFNEIILPKINQLRDLHYLNSVVNTPIDNYMQRGDQLFVSYFLFTKMIVARLVHDLRYSEIAHFVINYYDNLVQNNRSSYPQDLIDKQGGLNAAKWLNEELLKVE